MSPLNSLNLALSGELASNTTVKLHRKETVCSVVCRGAEHCLPGGVTGGVAGPKVTGSRARGGWSGWKNHFLHPLTCRLPSTVFNYSCSVCVCACVCVLYIPVYVCWGLCHCVWHTDVSVCAYPVGGAASRILARGFLPIRTLTKGTDGALRCALGSESPRFSTAAPQPPRPHPSDHSIHQGQLCTACAVSSKHLIILLWLGHSP